MRRALVLFAADAAQAARRGLGAAAVGRCSLPVAVAMLALTASPASAAWSIVSFDRRITSADREALAGLGAQIVQYRPRDSYVAWLPSRARAHARELAHVRWVRPLPRAARVSPALRRGALASQVLSFARGRVVSRRIEGIPSSNEVNALLRRRDVMWIGPAPTGLLPSDEATAQIVAGNLKAGDPGPLPLPGYPGWLRRLGLDGAGVKVAVVDSGVDPTHPDLKGRVLERVSYTEDGAASGGHGTHVAGIVAGDAATGRTDSGGFLMGAGVAPRARILDVAASAIFGRVALPPYDELDFPRYARDVLQRGVSIWNASLETGEGIGAGYIRTASTVDALVRDGDPQAPGNQGLTAVFSAGNYGGSESGSALATPAEAKNLIAVASSDSHRVQYEFYSTERSTTERISDFSSRGPAVDGRIAPLVTAPGQAVLSTRSREDPTFDDCTAPWDESVTPPEPHAAPDYAFCSGTSMAAPHVAGAVALLTQAWRRDHGGADPSPAMARALLVNSATDLGERDVPNIHEGWGRLDLSQLLAPGVPRITADQERLLGDPGGCHGLRFTVADPSRPLRATLAWTDVPGRPDADPALVNDLDLTLTGADGYLWRGNAFAAGRSVPSGEADRLNNLENVLIDEAAGSYELVVEAANVPGDGVPGAGDATDQDFALVLTNAVASGPGPGRCLPPPASTAAPMSAEPKRISQRVRRVRYRRCAKRARKIRSARKRATAVKRCRRIHLQRR